jgi:hypothetical protein
MRPSRPLPLSRLGALLAVVFLPALLHAAPPDGWEPVPAEQLALTRSVIEPGVGAEVISWRVWVEDGFSGNSLRQTRDHYVRLKIYTDVGAQAFAKVDIDYPLRHVLVESISARTIQPDGTVTPLGRKAVVRETVVKKKGEGLRRQSFAPPELKPGCVLEYRYQEIRYDAAAAGIYDLQRDVPVQRLVYYVRPLKLEGWNVRQMFFHVAAVSSPTPADGYYETAVSSRPAYKPEPFSPPEYEQRAWMLLYYTERELTSPEVFWGRYGREQWEWFDSYTRPDKETQALAGQITPGAASEPERVRRLAEWIQHEFKISHSDEPDSLRAAGLRKCASLRDALRQKGGTRWDANMAFAGLARSLGMQTRLMRVPSRRSQFFDRRMMNEIFLPSYQIGVRVDGQWRSLDPADRYLPWDMVPWYEEAQPALLCDRDSSRFMDTPMGEPERSCLSRNGTFTLSENGTVEGDVTLSFSGHWNQSMRWAFEGVAGAELEKTLLEETSWKDQGAKVSDVELLRGSDERVPLQVKCHLVLPGFAMVTGKRILLEPALLEARQRPPFTASTRRYPVYFDFAWSERDSLRLRLPEGWKAEAVVAPQPVNSPGLAAYEGQTRVSDDGRELLVQRSLRVGGGGLLLFLPGGYAAIKSLFDQVHERDQAVVALTRVGTQP